LMLAEGRRILSIFPSCLFDSISPFPCTPHAIAVHDMLGSAVDCRNLDSIKAVPAVPQMAHSPSPPSLGRSASLPRPCAPGLECRLVLLAHVPTCQAASQCAKDRRWQGLCGRVSGRGRPFWWDGGSVAASRRQLNYTTGHCDGRLPLALGQVSVKSAPKKKMHTPWARRGCKLAQVATYGSPCLARTCILGPAVGSQEM
jgi:hypothetical protein